jgi:hypothetical protein
MSGTRAHIIGVCLSRERSCRSNSSAGHMVLLARPHAALVVTQEIIWTVAWACAWDGDYIGWTIKLVSFFFKWCQKLKKIF